MKTRLFTINIVLLSAMAASPWASAEPRDTVWVESLRLQRPSSTEASFAYEYQVTDIKAMEEGIDLLSLRLATGLTDRVDIAPVLRFRQRGDEEFRLHDLGGLFRVRLLGEAGAPHLLVYGGYFNETSPERDHRFTAGIAGRNEFGRLFVSGEVRGSAYAGGEMENTSEVLVGGAAGYTLLSGRQLTAGIESFLLVPYGGARMSDPTFGDSAGSSSLYYGPSVSFHAGRMWTAFSAATGFAVSEPASNLLVRWMVGVSN